MKVYIVIEKTSNGVEFWEYIIDVYADQIAAEIRALELNEKAAPDNIEYDYKFYLVIEKKVL